MLTVEKATRTVHQPDGAHRAVTAQQGSVVSAEGFQRGCSTTHAQEQHVCASKALIRAHQEASEAIDRSAPAGASRKQQGRAARNHRAPQQVVVV